MLNLPSFLKSPRERRREEIRRQPFPEAWLAYLDDHVAHYALLDEAEAARLRDDLRFFIAEKRWEGGAGSEVSEEMQVTIAAQACLLLVGWEDARRRGDLFPNVETIIVYPSGYRARRQRRSGVVETVEMESMLGEAWEGNWPVVLAWDGVRSGGEDNHDGHNLVLHEFAHKLDMIHGGADGVPRLSSAAEYEEWARVMSEAFRRLRFYVWEGRESVLDGYGAENEAEFFAVATEAFFEKPIQMEEYEPDLYTALKGYYQQDIAARARTWHEREWAERRTTESLETEEA
jgi:Mlc titration factor MtfA (ptsG expression regulator)